MTEPMESVDISPVATAMENGLNLAEKWLMALEKNDQSVGAVIFAGAFVLVSLAKSVGLPHPEYLKMLELVEEALDEPSGQD